MSKDYDSNSLKGHYRTTLLQDILNLLIKIALIGLGAGIVFTLLFGLHRYNNDNMNPALQEGDLLLYNRLDKNYVSGDVTILSYEGQDQVQRVMAVPGDTVTITEDGYLTVNGGRPVEKYVFTETNAYKEGVEFPYIVPEGEIFVMSDNRENTEDSRLYGSVKAEDTYGTVMTVIRRRNI